MGWRTCAAAAAGIAAAIAFACDDPLPMEFVRETVDDIDVTVSLVDGADRLVVDLEIRNRDSERRDVLWGAGCNPTIEVYDAAAEADRIVWNERQWREDAGGCIPVSRNSSLVPGGAAGSRHEVRDDDVLGDSLAAGVYRVVVVFRMQQPEAELNLDAGAVRIGRP